MILQFYAAPIEEKTLGQLHGVTLSGVQRVIVKAEEALEKTLKREYLARVMWPSKQEQIAMAKLVEDRFPGI